MNNQATTTTATASEKYREEITRRTAAQAQACAKYTEAERAWSEAKSAEAQAEMVRKAAKEHLDWTTEKLNEAIAAYQGAKEAERAAEAPGSADKLTLGQRGAIADAIDYLEMIGEDDEIAATAAEILGTILGREK